MIRKLLFSSLLSLFSFSIMAQKISVLLPKESNKKYYFVINKGIVRDTIQTGNLSFVGSATVNIPVENKDYRGMSVLQIQDLPGINVILNKEGDISFEQTVDGKFIFKNSKENEALYDILQGKSQNVKDTTLYANHFMNTLRYMFELNKLQSSNVDLMTKANARLYALQKLDMDFLYTTGIWYNVVDGIVKIVNNQEQMANDMVTILKKIKSEEVFEHLADNLITITEQFGWDDAFDIIVSYVKDSGRIPEPRGKMYIAFVLSKVSKGRQAPMIDGLDIPLDKSAANKTLLVFYDPDCASCKTQINKLIKDYKRLQDAGVRIVSISVGYDKMEFEQDKVLFPWEDKLCDFNGFTGVNVSRYGILGTPTFFLLDKDLKVIKRSALLSDFDLF